ncbi:hypothetical protein [Flammeovirga sp. SubArs3]|uniref:hypothetical protein n=1 Tax=Flammeovirga sp. SubArs3 TaxID=2995316 RepID=UPI00248B2DE4|nr:hypothetical protein [Flammeovirga sp. SubArs3]
MKNHLLTVLVLLASITLTKAQLPSGGGDRIKEDFKFIPLPYLDFNKSYGWTIGAFPMAMYNPSKKDTISPSSVGGLGVMYSENGTWYGMGFGMNYLNEDQWRLTYALGFGNDNFQFYANNPINRWIPYTTQSDFIYLDVKKRVWSDLFFGANYLYSRLKTTTEYDVLESENTLNGVGLEATFDRRSNVTYPRSGYQATIYYISYPKAFNDIVSNQIIIDYNHYFSTRQEKDVIALRFHSGLAIGQIDFNQQFIVGETDIRGYSKGQYRGNYLLAIQGEYRYNFHDRLGLVGFIGLATVFESSNPSNDGELLPGIGTGFRYTYMKDTHSNVGFDVGFGKDDWSFSLMFSEAF